MNTFIVKPNGTGKSVKNLGWMLRHWKQVERITFSHGVLGIAGDGILCAIMKDGSMFKTEFASLSVCWGFLNRPIFRDFPFSLSIGNDRETKFFTIGNPEWRNIQAMPYKAQIEKLLSK